MHTFPYELDMTVQECCERLMSVRHVKQTFEPAGVSYMGNHLWVGPECLMHKQAERIWLHAREAFRFYESDAWRGQSEFYHSLISLIFRETSALPASTAFIQRRVPFAARFDGIETLVPKESVNPAKPLVGATKIGSLNVPLAPWLPNLPLRNVSFAYRLDDFGSNTFLSRMRRERRIESPNSHAISGKDVVWLLAGPEDRNASGETQIQSLAAHITADGVLGTPTLHFARINPLARTVNHCLATLWPDNPETATLAFSIEPRPFEMFLAMYDEERHLLFDLLRD